MSYLNLNVSNLNLSLDLSEVGTDEYGKLFEIFSTFVSNNGNNSHETLKVFRLEKGDITDNASELEHKIKKIAEFPLNKFPFSAHPKRRIQAYLGSVKSYLRDSRFVSFFDDLTNLEDAIIFPLKDACLVRRLNPLGSAIFLKRGSSIGNTESIREAVYLLLSMALPSVNSVMLHGVGIKRYGMGYLFLGNSGAGKSTIAQCSSLEDIVSDDGIIVEKKEIEYHLRPSPINQSSNLISNLKENELYDIKLSKGFFIIKDTTDYIEEVSPPEACSIILKNHMHYFRYFPLDSVIRSVSILSNLCRQIPFFMLHFRKDSTIWSIIDGDGLKMQEQKGSD